VGEIKIKIRINNQLLNERVRFDLLILEKIGVKFHHHHAIKVSGIINADRLVYAPII